MNSNCVQKCVCGVRAVLSKRNARNIDHVMACIVSEVISHHAAQPYAAPNPKKSYNFMNSLRSAADERSGKKYSPAAIMQPRIASITA